MWVIFILKLTVLWHTPRLSSMIVINLRSAEKYSNTWCIQALKVRTQHQSEMATMQMINLGHWECMQSPPLENVCFQPFLANILPPIGGPPWNLRFHRGIQRAPERVKRQKEAQPRWHHIADHRPSAITTGLARAVKLTSPQPLDVKCDIHWACMGNHQHIHPAAKDRIYGALVWLKINFLQWSAGREFWQWVLDCVISFIVNKLYKEQLLCIVLCCKVSHFGRDLGAIALSFGSLAPFYCFVGALILSRWTLKLSSVKNPRLWR